MESFFIVQMQILKMLLFSVLGYILFSVGWLRQRTVNKMSFLLIWIINPIVILLSYQKTFEIFEFKKLFISLISSAFIMAIIFTINSILTDDRVEKVSLAFGNAGFMGIPLVLGIGGLQSVFYLSAYIADFNIFCYTYGIFILSGKSKNISLKNLLNPGFVSVILGLIFYVFSIKIPVFLYKPFKTLTLLNTPIAMIIIGTYFEQIRFKNSLRKKEIYEISFLKLLVFPLVVFVLLKITPFLDFRQKLVILIATGTPTGITIPILVKLYKKDYYYATELVGISTMLSIITLPIIILIGELFLK